MKFSWSEPKKFTDMIHNATFRDRCGETHGNDPWRTSRTDEFDLLEYKTEAQAPHVEEINFVNPECTKPLPKRFVLEQVRKTCRNELLWRQTKHRDIFSRCHPEIFAAQPCSRKCIRVDGYSSQSVGFKFALLHNSSVKFQAMLA